VTDLRKIPDAALIEIVERDHSTGPGAAGVVVPNDVRINGQSLLCSGEHPVVVHEITTRADQAVYVTLTLLARRVVIGAENDSA
jgi:hypothetical protein